MNQLKKFTNNQLCELFNNNFADEDIEERIIFFNKKFYQIIVQKEIVGYDRIGPIVDNAEITTEITKKELLQKIRQ